MKVVRFAHLFLAVTALMSGITSGGFAADLSVETVAEEQYAWLVSAEAQAEQALDRAFLDFDSSLIDGDVITVASPWLRAFKLGGRWENLASGKGAPDWLARRTAWHVAQGENGALCLILNRDLLGNAEIELQIEFFDGGAELFVDLVTSNEEIIASSSDYGNLLEGTGDVVVKALKIPLSLYPETRGIYLRGEGGEGLPERGQGGLFVLGAVLLVTRSGSVSEQILDQPVQGRANPPGEPYPRQDGSAGPLRWEASAGRGRLALPIQKTTGRKSIPPALRAKPVSAKTIPQFVQALLTDSDFQVSRFVLSGGGGRQVAVAGNLILEDTFAQASAIGFSSNSSIILHAGYQQADDQPLEIWNPSALPSTFNPLRGEKTTLSYVLSTRPRSVSIEISNTVSGVTNVLVNNAPQGPGLRTFVWDGRDTNGNYLSLDPWMFWIRALDYRGRVVATNTPIRLRQIPVIRSVSDSPDPFCPATDLTNAISYTTDAAQNLDVTLDIEDASGNPVASFSANNQAPGSYVFNWDGTGVTRDGLYVYRINARRGQAANEKSGSIILGCGQECATSADGKVKACYQPNGFSIAISNATPAQLSEASSAVLTAAPRLLFQGRIYDIQASPPTNFVSPAILSFQYDPAIIGDIGAQLSLRRYDPAITNWVIVSPQFVDYANNQILAEVTSLSLFALFAVEEPSAPGVLRAEVRLEPEVLKVNPGILTAFVSLPAGYDPLYITSATCEGAASESMAFSADGTEMVIKFRRQAIEAALSEQGETLDTHFVVEGIWQGAEGPVSFAGEDDIARIIH